MKDRQWSDHHVGGSHGSENEVDARLDEFVSRLSRGCLDPEPSVNFMPEMWAKN